VENESVFLDARLLKVFCVAAEELHFGKAATALSISQPVVSQQIKRLEQHVGTGLFVRTTRAVQLTQAGEVMYRHAKQISSQTDCMLRRVRQAARGEAGALSIGLTPTVACTLAKALDRYRSSHPETDLHVHELHSVEMPGALRLRTIDVAFMRPMAVEAGIQTRQFFQESMRLAMRRDHPLARNRSVTLEEIAAYPMVGYRNDLSPYFNRLVRALFADLKLVPKIAQESVAPTLLMLVEAGVGVAIVPDSLTRPYQRALKFLPLANVQKYKASIVVAQLHKQSKPAVPDFLKMVRGYQLENNGAVHRT
jgi:DNA-binding transcriptional LysR family regulator